MEILVSRIVNPFHSPKKTLGTLSADIVARLISSAADVALVVDKSGVIRDVAIGSEDLSKAGLGGWVGVPWMDTVTSDSRHKVEELMREAALKLPTRWREVNHIGPGGRTCAGPVFGPAGEGGWPGRRIRPRSEGSGEFAAATCRRPDVDRTGLC